MSDARFARTELLLGSEVMKRLAIPCRGGGAGGRGQLRGGGSRAWRGWASPWLTST